MLLGAVVAIVVGILAGRHLGPGAGTGWLVAAMVFAGSGFLFRHWRRAAACAAAALCLGSAGMQRTNHGLTESPFTPLTVARTVGEVRGRLVDDPQTRRYVTRVTVRVAAIATPSSGSISGGRRHVQLVANGAIANRLAVLTAGDSVTVRVALQPLVGRDVRLRDRHVVASARVIELVGFSESPPGLLWAANQLRGIVLTGLGSMPASARALAAGFLLGETSAIPDATVQRFRASGLSHLLAVSGANLAFVAACLAPILRRFQLTGRFIGGALVVVVFGAMTRFEPSVVRASAMALLVLLADRLGRPASAARILGLATIGALLVDPLLMFRTGFQLSVGATTGLVLLTAPIAARLPGPRGLREAVAVPMAAQVGVLPVALATFGSLPLVSLPANLAAQPLAAPITVLGFLTAVIGWLIGPWLPGVAQVVHAPVVGLLGAVDAIAALAARVPLAVDVRAVAGLAALGCAIGAWRSQRSSGAVPGRPLTSGRSRAEVRWPASSP